MINMQDCSVEINKINKDEWSDLLNEFDDATIYQTWSYGMVRWGEKNLHHIIVKKNNEVIGIAQLVIKKIPFIKAGIAYIPWGPLWQKKGHENNVEVFEYLIKVLHDEYVVKQKLFFRMTPNIVDSDKNNNICSVLANAGFKKNITASNYRTFLVDLSPTLPEIRKKLNPKWRNKLNGAEKNKLEIIEGNDIELYRIFQKLQKEMQERKEYIPGVDYYEFGMIQQELPEHLKMQIMICKHDGEPIAATIVSAIGETGIYLLGATGDKWSNLKGSYLLHWKMMMWLKEHGQRMYDLGGINPTNNPGVYTFKAGFSGQDVFHIGQYELCQNYSSSFIIKLYEKFEGYRKQKNHKYLNLFEIIR
ncbi:MAG: peptidoglycan bridge formation glycyltransferase FemA/FemB family protein [Syntrophomonas sp.]